MAAEPILARTTNDRDQGSTGDHFPSSGSGSLSWPPRIMESQFRSAVAPLLNEARQSYGREMFELI